MRQSQTTLRRYYSEQFLSFSRPSCLPKTRTSHLGLLYIYRQAWDDLDELARAVFLAMPLVTNRGGTLASLADVTELDTIEVGDVLNRLVALSLVDSRGDLHQRRYTIHRLTRAFLLEQVVAWQ